MKKILMFIVSFGLMFSAIGADQWDKSDPAGTESPSDLDTLITTNNGVLDRLLADYREGMRVTYASASSLSVSAGQIACDNVGRTLRRWRENTSATTVTWSNIDTGAEEASTTYYVYAVADTDATTFTIEISKNSSAPSGATYYKRLGYFYNDSDSNIDTTSIVNDNETSFPAKVSPFIYDSGWFAVSVGNTYTKTHNLGTTNVVVNNWFSTDSSGSGNTYLNPRQMYEDNSTRVEGGGIVELSSTSIKVRYANVIYRGVTTSADDSTDITSGYARIIILALE